MGHRYYFQYTICDYPHALEPHVPPLAERIATAHRLAKRIGPRRVIWRYDPIIVSNNTDFEYQRISAPTTPACTGVYTVMPR